jgi:hypothetical protein
VSAAISRSLFAILMCVSVIALTLPLRAAQPAASHTMSCCAKPAAAKSDNHCRHQTPAPEEEHCCAACAIGLSLFLTPPANFIFSRERGEQLVAAAAAELSRSEQPPVPPPRATAA